LLYRAWTWRTTSTRKLPPTLSKDTRYESLDDHLDVCSCSLSFTTASPISSPSSSRSVRTGLRSDVKLRGMWSASMLCLPADGYVLHSVPQTTEAVSLPVEAQVQEAVLTSSSAPLRPIPVADIHVRAEAPLPSPPRTMPSLPAPPRTNPIRMPPPGSDDWEAVDVEAIMAKPTKTKKKKTKVAM
jgi:hypothetical protein